MLALFSTALPTQGPLGDVLTKSLGSVAIALRRRMFWRFVIGLRH